MSGRARTDGCAVRHCFADWALPAGSVPASTLAPVTEHRCRAAGCSSALLSPRSSACAMRAVLPSRRSGRSWELCVMRARYLDIDKLPHARVSHLSVAGSRRRKQTGSLRSSNARTTPRTPMHASSDCNRRCMFKRRGGGYRSRQIRRWSTSSRKSERA